MKNIILFLFLFSLLSCAKSEVTLANHWKYLNLNSKVKQMKISFYKYEIDNSEEGYSLSGKTKYLYNDQILKEKNTDIDFAFNLNNSSFMYDYNRLRDSYHLSLDAVFGSSGMFSGYYMATDYILTFNEEGFVTKSQSLMNDTILCEADFFYDKQNRLIKSESISDNTKFIKTFIYTDDGLLKHEIWKSYDGKNQDYEFMYEYNNANSELQIVTIKSKGWVGGVQKLDVKEIHLYKNNNIIIKSVNMGFNKITTIFNNKLITQIYRQQGNEFISNIEYVYFNNKIIGVKMESHDHFLTDSITKIEYLFSYNQKNDLETVYNKDFPNYRYKCIYKYDDQDNWIEQDYSLQDRTAYDKIAKLFIEEKERTEKLDKKTNEMIYERTPLFFELAPKYWNAKALSDKVITKREYIYY